MPSGLLNQVALPSKLKRAAGKHIHHSAQCRCNKPSFDFTNYLLIRIIWHYSREAINAQINKPWTVSEYFTLAVSCLWPANIFRMLTPPPTCAHTWWLGDNILYKFSAQMSALHVVTSPLGCYAGDLILHPSYLHTSPQSSINLENSPRQVTWFFRMLRYHIERLHWPSNQIIPVFGDFLLNIFFLDFLIFSSKLPAYLTMNRDLMTFSTLYFTTYDISSTKYI